MDGTGDAASVLGQHLPGARAPRTERWAASGMRGGTIWLTGLPGAGKTTIAAALEEHLLGGARAACVLDGDLLRRGLTSDLGFSRADRQENVRRVAEMAALVADAGCVAIVALVSPYAEDRGAARALHEREGLPFLEVHVDAPPEVCAARDPKGLYARAAAGELAGLTGAGAPYEPPTAPALVVRTDELALPVIVDRIASMLRAV